MSETLRALKARSEARLHEEKKVVDRNRNLLTLILRHLVDNGFANTAERLQMEGGVSLSKYDVADNIDLVGILHQWEDYHTFKFGKPPKIVRRSDGATGSEKSSQSQKTTTSKHNSDPKEVGRMASKERRDKRNNYTGHIGKGSGIDNTTIPTAMKGKLSGLHPVLPDAREDPVIGPPQDMGVEGNKMNVQKSGKSEKSGASREEEDGYRLLKPLPSFGDADMRALGSVITRDIYQRSPGVYWDDIVELDNAKKLLQEAVVMPTKYPELFTGLLSPWKGILLFGPPGTGKTMLARAVATECKTTFFNISASSIISKYRGDSEKLVRVLFELARYHAPSTIFIDELDSIMSARGSGREHEASHRMKTELLIQMDGLAKGSELVFVLAASNLPWSLDQAMLRRLEKRILVPLPGLSARELMFEKILSKCKVATGSGSKAGETIDSKAMAMRTEGYSGADIHLVVKEAAMRPLRRLMNKLATFNEDQLNSSKLRDAMDPISMDDIIASLGCTKASTSMKSDLYAKWQDEYGSSI